MVKTEIELVVRPLPEDCQVLGYLLAQSRLPNQAYGRVAGWMVSVAASWKWRKESVKPILMIEEGVGTYRDGSRFIDPEPWGGVAGLEDITPIVFEQDILAIVDVLLRLPIGDFLDASP